MFRSRIKNSKHLCSFNKIELLFNSGVSTLSVQLKLSFSNNLNLYVTFGKIKMFAVLFEMWALSKQRNEEN